jgi:hypothetical protein
VGYTAANFALPVVTSCVPWWLAAKHVACHEQGKIFESRVILEQNNRVKQFSSNSASQHDPFARKSKSACEWPTTGIMEEKLSGRLEM